MKDFKVVMAMVMNEKGYPMRDDNDRVIESPQIYARRDGIVVRVTPVAIGKWEWEVKELGYKDGKFSRYSVRRQFGESTDFDEAKNLVTNIYKEWRF